MHKIQVDGDDQVLTAAFHNVDQQNEGPYVWSSSDPSKATITPIGDGKQATLHAVASGTTNITITAASGSLTEVLAVQVLAADQAGVFIQVETPGAAAPGDPAATGMAGQIPGGSNPT